MEDAESRCDRSLSSICSSAGSVSSIVEASKSLVEDIEFLRGRADGPARGCNSASAEWSLRFGTGDAGLSSPSDDEVEFLRGLC